MEAISDLKARIIRCTNSSRSITAHNKALINEMARDLYARSGEVMVNGRFVKAA